MKHAGFCLPSRSCSSYVAQQLFSLRSVFYVSFLHDVNRRRSFLSSCLLCYTTRLTEAQFDCNYSHITQGAPCTLSQQSVSRCYYTEHDVLMNTHSYTVTIYTMLANGRRLLPCTASIVYNLSYLLTFQMRNTPNSVVPDCDGRWRFTMTVSAARRTALARHLLSRRGCLCVCHVDVLCPND